MHSYLDDFILGQRLLRLDKPVMFFFVLKTLSLLSIATTETTLAPTLQSAPTTTVGDTSQQVGGSTAHLFSQAPQETWGRGTTHAQTVRTRHSLRFLCAWEGGYSTLNSVTFSPVCNQSSLPCDDWCLWKYPPCSQQVAKL